MEPRLLMKTGDRLAWRVRCADRARALATPQLRRWLLGSESRRCSSGGGTACRPTRRAGWLSSPSRLAARAAPRRRWRGARSCTPTRPAPALTRDCRFRRASPPSRMRSSAPTTAVALFEQGAAVHDGARRSPRVDRHGRAATCRCDSRRHSIGAARSPPRRRRRRARAAGRHGCAAKRRRATRRCAPPPSGHGVTAAPPTSGSGREGEHGRATHRRATLLGAAAPSLGAPLDGAPRIRGGRVAALLRSISPPRCACAARRDARRKEAVRPFA